MNNTRMCVACKSRKQKNQLIKVILDKENNLIICESNNIFGRGAYICKDSACIEKVIKTKALNKAFKKNVNEQNYLKLRS